jgi:hypothetical protein
MYDSLKYKVYIKCQFALLLRHVLHEGTVVFLKG